MIMEQGCHMEKFCYAKQNQIKNSQPQANCVNDNQETFFLFIYLLASHIDDKKMSISWLIGNEYFPHD